MQNFLTQYPDFESSQLEFKKPTTSGEALQKLSQLIDGINFGTYTKLPEKTIMSKISSALHEFIGTLKQGSEAYNHAIRFAEETGIRFAMPNADTAKTSKTSKRKSSKDAEPSKKQKSQQEKDDIDILYVDAESDSESDDEDPPFLQSQILTSDYENLPFVQSDLVLHPMFQIPLEKAKRIRRAQRKI